MSPEPPADIASWLARHGLDKYAAVFEAHEIGIDQLTELGEDHLKELGLPLGPRLRLLKAVAQDAPAIPVPVPASPGKTLASERRPVTVMFCDLVGSVQLTSTLDPEATRSLMLQYWRLVDQAAAQHLGHIAQHLGDGALIYFGYPEARENDAERAVLAALSLLDAMAALPSETGPALHVRIGIATGTVVLNEFGAQAGVAEILAIGHAVHLASRLQTLADPDTVVIDSPTHDLVRGLFQIGAPAAMPVTGIQEPVMVYRVDGVALVRSRFEARRSGAGSAGRDTVFLGRSSELNLLLNRWEAALAGLPQLVLIAGEPGIGKSRLLAEAAVRMSRHSHRLVQLQCSPNATGTPLQPVIDWLAQLAGLAPGDRRQAIARKLQGCLPTGFPDLDALADLLDPHGSAPAGDPLQRRLQTLSALSGLLKAMAAAQPLLLVAEDLHWCDPTTLELFQRLLARAEAQPLLLLATARPEFKHDFGRMSSRTDIALPRLDRTHADALMKQVLGAQQISTQLLDMVAERADGVPLFVEELVRSLSESGAIVEAERGMRLGASIDHAAVPRGLESILMARVDMLGPLKPVAQMAACIGRGFSLDLLAQVTGTAVALLREQVDGIAHSDLIVGDGQAPFVSYRFRHALVRDAAYNSLLLSERQPIHQRIAEILAAATDPPAPEVLARHLSLAQLHLPAIEQWCKAGEAAKQRSADAEAIEHFTQALRLVEQLPAPQRRERELDVLLALVAPLRALKGFAADDVAKMTVRALSVADDLKDPRRILPMLYNHWVYTFVTSHRQQSENLARDMLARSLHDPTNLVRMTGLRAVAATLFTAGDFRQATQTFEESIALYEQAAQADLTQAVGLDGKVTALGYSSLARWCLGDVALAHSQQREALAHARLVNHISTTAFITYHQALLAGVLEREPAVLLANGSRLEAIGQEHRFEMWLIGGKLLQSLGRCLIDPNAQHLATAEALFIDFEGMGVVYRPLYATLLAQTCLHLDQPERGLNHLKTAQALMNQTGERWCEAEVLRLDGVLRRHIPGAADEAAAASFKRALALARAQHAQRWQDRIEQSAGFTA